MTLFLKCDYCGEEVERAFTSKETIKKYWVGLDNDRYKIRITYSGDLCRKCLLSAINNKHINTCSDDSNNWPPE